MSAWRRWALFAGAGLLLVVLGYALGRYAVPPKVVVQERVKVEQVEHQVVVVQEKVRVERVEVSAAAQESHRVATSLKRPDGTVETRVEENRQSERASSNSTVAALEESSRVERSTSSISTSERTTTVEARPNWRLSGLAGVQVSALKPTYGAAIERRLIGPVSVGAWGLSSGVGGVSLSLEF